MGGSDLDENAGSVLSDNQHHALPQSGQDVPDDFDARLVVLGADYPHSRDSSSAAETAAKAILETRGSAPRLYRNTLVFLAADKTRLQDLDESIRRYLAWQSVLDEKNELDLTPHQVRQAETQKASADSAVNARLPETFQWLLMPQQPTPQSAVEWQSFRLSGQEPLAARASRKLKNDELLVTGLAATRLRLELDQVPLWRGDYVPVKQLVEDFARYLYLPRLRDTTVLLDAIREGVGLLTWGRDSFAYAESYDEARSRYLGLRCGQTVSLSTDNLVGLLVKPEPALKQQDDETPRPATGGTPIGANPTNPGGDTPTVAGPGSTAGEPPNQGQPKRFHGSITLDAARVGRDASRVADEVISHLSGLIGANVRVTLEIEAELPNGAPANVIRTVNENSRTLKFDNQGFEQE